MVPIVYNKEGTEQIATLVDCIECLVEEERNGILELTLVYPNNIVAEQLIQENIIVADVNDTLINQQFRIYDVVKLMDNQLEVTARHISFDLAFDIIDSIEFTNQSCEYALNTIFRNSQFSKHYLGHSDIINAQDYSISKCSCQEAICGKKGSIIDTFGTGAEILRDNTDIYVYNNRGHDNDVTIEYAKNLTGFELEEDTSELVTRIIPYAKFQDPDTQENEEIWVTDGVDSPLIEQYAHPYIQYIDYSDKFEQDETPTTTKLVEMARAEFEEHGKDRPKQNFKIEFIPLSKCVGYEGIEDKISLCDTVTIIDTRYNINTKAKVIKTVYNVLKDRYESMELGDARSTLNDILTSDSNKYVTKEELSEAVDNAKPIFPNILPEKPTLTCNVRGFASIELNWTYESEVFYEYELYASKIEDFTPTTFDLIHKGQTSSFLFQVEPDETWYFRVCAVNTHGNRTEFSNQATGTTQKIDDMENYFTSAAIGNALIGSLNADYMTAGIIQGHWIDARNLSVTNGNGIRTLDIDSFGNVSLDVSNLKIENNNISDVYATKTSLEQTSEDFTFRISQSRGGNLIKNSLFKNEMNYWSLLNWDNSDISGHWWGVVPSYSDLNMNKDNCIEISARVHNPYGILRTGIDGDWIDVKPNTAYSFTGYIASHRSSNIVFEIYHDEGTGYSAYMTGWDLGKVGESYVGAKNYDCWTRIEKTFFTGANTKRIFVRFYMGTHDHSSDTTAYMWLALPCLVEGSVAMEWVAHESEVYDGIVKIDNQGITVTHSNYANFKTVMSSTGFECIHTSTKSTLLDSEGLHTKLIRSNGYYRFKHKSLITKGTILTQGLGYDETLSVILPWQYNDLDANNDVSLMLVCNCPIADGYNWYNISYWNMSSGAPLNSWYKNSSGYWQCDDLFAYCLISAKDPRSDGTYYTQWARMYINYIVFA